MPTTEQNGTTSSDTLQGWKDIANYLGRSTRAVQRWERELDLPVHRIQTTNGQTVYARRTELDDWRRSRDLPKPLPEDGEEAHLNPESSAVPQPARAEAAPVRPTLPPRWTPFAAITVATLALGIWVGKSGWASSSGVVNTIQATGTTVAAYDVNNRIVWAHDMGEQVSHPSTRTGSIPAAGTLLGASGMTVVPIRSATAGEHSPMSDALVAFDRSGRQLWRFAPTNVLHCGSETFSGPWNVSAMVIASDLARPRVWISYTHQTWWPSLLFEIDEQGHASLRYLQSGWIRNLTEWRSPRGTFLGVGGVLNQYQLPSAALVDLDAGPSATPSDDPRFRCQEAPTGTPARMFLFPNLDLLGPSTYAMATMLKPLVDGLQIELDEGGGGALFELDNALHVRSFSLADHYWSQHRDLEARGAMRHTSDACPERTRRQPIREWAAGTGWTPYTIAPTPGQSVAK